MGIRILDDLIKHPDGIIHIACDTEFQGPHTLTAQFAVRVGSTVVVQVYRSPAIPDLPAGFSLRGFPKGIRKWCKGVVLRPVKPIVPRLSPVRVLADLLELDSIKPVHRLKADERLQALFAVPITVTLVGHFWPADFFRVFGARFFSDLLLAPSQARTQLIIQSNKLLRFHEVGRGVQRYADPVLEYLRSGDEVYPLKVRTFDTALPFGKGSLDSHAQTFLGIKKLESISSDDKAKMLQTFRDRPGDAYHYAILDTVITLLVEERMREEDRKMYLALGFGQKTPVLRPTQGARVAEMITKTVTRTCAAGSVELSQKGKPLLNGGVGKVSIAKVNQLLNKGSGKFIAEEKLSMFGTQTGETHGGLLFSRSPTKFFHAAPGMFRDVDLTGCYNSIISGMKMYIGQPVIYEPGSRQMTLKEAVAFLREHAAARDAWIIKVGGNITACPNAFIPSTNGALTNANYRSRRAKKRAKSRRCGFLFDWLFESRKQTGNSTLYTEVIEAGMVAWSTWLVIQALPEKVRKEHELLEVETILFYPAKLVARFGSEFDALVQQYESEQTPWMAQLDMGGMKHITVEKLDDDYVSLEFDIGSLAKKIAGFRQQAKEKYDKESGAELAWKQHGNSMYGVCASRHLVTNSVVTANVITATARALAYSMQMALNGVQVITDGCTYRRDQIPTYTFAECLQASADYPIRRVEAGVEFIDPATIPQDDAGFTGWYREHVKRFFGMSGAEYDELFSIHGLEHKFCGEPKRAAFDGLCCDGSGNYLKLLKRETGWKVADFKARSFNREAKEKLAPWLLRTYLEDHYTGPPPLTEMASLASYKDAVRLARQALRDLDSGRSPRERQHAPLRVVFPLGLDMQKVLAYKVIKPSGFLFRTPKQREKVRKAIQQFGETYACGLELLALRRGHQGRRKGSIADVAQRLYGYIHAGGDNLVKDFNLTRRSKELDAVRQEYSLVIEDRKRQQRESLFRAIDARQLPNHARLTGLLLGEEDLIRIG